MAIELGKAYVQILPSAKGISGSIQKAIAPEALNAGKAAGKNIASAISESLSKAGDTLTKSITAPALAATTAVAGLVGALGFKRLVGMDEARAKLKGLGIEGKQLEVVMKSVKNAVTGTTHTMADGVSVAAGALAAGVKEGAELERYIKLVGDAAIGANVPIMEMAQIFNRIQGQGKITRNELDMLEYRLPGFSQALMKHVGAGSQEAFFEMVRAGKVSTEDVLDTMEGFAGGMAAAYAETWSGLKDNILANIGIIGEALLEGLFEDGKKGMAEFLQYLRESEGLKEWAQNTGETLRNVFATIVEVIKNAINWWTNLSDGAKTAFLSFAGIAVAIGPIMMVMSKLISIATTVYTWFGKLKYAVGILIKALGGISSPVLIVVGVIAGLIALFVALYRTNEDFRNLVQTVWESIKTTISTVIQTISDFVMKVWGSLVAWWNENNELIQETIQVVWEKVQEVIMKVLDIVVPIIQTAWDVIKIATENVWNNIKTAIEIAITLIMGIIKTVMQIINGDWKGAWNTIKETAQKIWDIIKNYISDIVNKIKDTIKEKVDEAKQKVIEKFTELKTKAIDKVIELKTEIKNKFIEIKDEMINKAKEAVDEVIKKIKELPGKIKDKATEFFDAGRNIVQSIIDGIKSKIEDIGGAMSQVAQKARNFLPFSPAKEGPLRDIMDVKWGETIAAGILKGERTIENAMERALDFDLTKKATFNVNSNQAPHHATQQQPQPIILQVDGKTFAQIIGDYTSAEGGNRIRRIERGLAT